MSRRTSGWDLDQWGWQPRSCSLCHESFVSQRTLEAHVGAEHHCDQCDNNFVALREHQEGMPIRFTTSRTSYYRCNGCDMAFTTFDMVATHVWSFPVLHERTCLSCEIEFYDAAGSECHARHCPSGQGASTTGQGASTTGQGAGATGQGASANFGQTPLQYLQGWALGTPNSERAQMPSQVRCRSCNTTFENRTELQTSHASSVILSTFLGQWKCLACDRNFRNELAIRQHIATSSHHRSSCRHCGLEFSTASFAACHQRRRHAGAQGEIALRHQGDGESELEQEGDPEEAIVEAPPVTAERDSEQEDPPPVPEAPQETPAADLLRELHRITDTMASANSDMLKLQTTFSVAECDLAVLRARVETMSENESSSRTRPQNPIGVACPICVDTCKDHTATGCGHLFCAPCITQWIRHEGTGARCPACSARVGLGDLRRIYM